MNFPTVSELYFEAHVTIDPVFGFDRDKAEDIARQHNFKLVKFLGSLGFFTYTGVYGMHPGWWPLARVKYSDGALSIKMPVGNAFNSC